MPNEHSIEKPYILKVIYNYDGQKRREPGLNI